MTWTRRSSELLNAYLKEALGQVLSNAVLLGNVIMQDAQFWPEAPSVLLLHSSHLV